VGYHQPSRVTSQNQRIPRKSDGCPTFAPAYVGRKRRAKPNDRFLLPTEP
jgi:hypothetical protein